MAQTKYNRSRRCTGPMYVLIAVLAVAVAALLALLIAGVVLTFGERGQTQAVPAAQVSATETAPAPTQPEVFEAELLAVGDNLIHDTLYQSGMKADGTRDYSSFYANVVEDVQGADLAVIDQETVLGGDAFGFSGYPMFNSPQEIGDAAVAAGFDVFTCATNHVMDMGERGVTAEIDYFETKHPETVYLGVNRTEEDYRTVKYAYVNGIRFALLNYTFGTNGIPLPEDKPWLVDLLDDKEKMAADITAARENSDVVVVFPHWGVEYSMSVSDEQRDLVKFFSDLGVDIVIGCHPHVIEPVEIFVNETTGRKTAVFYSMGNFISHQHEPEKLLGGMVKVKVRKENGSVSVTEAKLIPLMTYYIDTDEGYVFTTLKLSDYTDEHAAKHMASWKYGYDVSPAHIRALYEDTVAPEFRE